MIIAAICDVSMFYRLIPTYILFVGHKLSLVIISKHFWKHCILFGHLWCKSSIPDYFALIWCSTWIEMWAFFDIPISFNVAVLTKRPHIRYLTLVTSFIYSENILSLNNFLGSLRKLRRLWKLTAIMLGVNRLRLSRRKILNMLHLNNCKWQQIIILVMRYSYVHPLENKQTKMTCSNK